MFSTKNVLTYVVYEWSLSNSFVVVPKKNTLLAYLPPVDFPRYQWEWPLRLPWHGLLKGWQGQWDPPHKSRRSCLKPPQLVGRHALQRPRVPSGHPPPDSHYPATWNKNLRPLCTTYSKMEKKNILKIVRFQPWGRFLTRLTKFCPLLTTYLSTPGQKKSKLVNVVPKGKSGYHWHFQYHVTTHHINVVKERPH